jgi:hypothetical protein
MGTIVAWIALVLSVLGLAFAALGASNDQDGVAVSAVASAVSPQSAIGENLTLPSDRSPRRDSSHPAHI